MKRKISYVVLFAEVMAIILLHVVKYQKEQSTDIVKSSFLKVETTKNSAPNTAVMAKMNY